MPMYAFTCNVCHQPFDKLVRSADAVSEVVCPSCGSGSIKKQLSMFAAKVSGGSFASAPEAACSTGGT
ncbi:MAG: zinc ribbon domain-containing protein [Chloroflexi bacterium]|nr:zinc ribbon domain-containing protein [Chloroflexota bacterium]